MPDSTRQLAAIMFTDIVGYTALMGEDSNKALELVHQSKEMQKPLVEKHNGKWLKEMGDGVMAQFRTALDGVNCALEIQRASRADFEGDLRKGIHLGDITIEDNDVYGDGVNLASRLQSIADPGGITFLSPLRSLFEVIPPFKPNTLVKLNSRILIMELGRMRYRQLVYLRRCLIRTGSSQRESGQI